MATHLQHSPVLLFLTDTGVGDPWGTVTTHLQHSPVLLFLTDADWA